MTSLIASISRSWRQLRLLAQILRGGFQPGLAKVVRQNVAEQLQSNSEFRAYRYPRVMRLARWAVDHFVHVLIIVFLIYASAFLLADCGGLANFGLFTVPSDFLTINIGVLAVQAALVGLVFPLVIAFVGLLNQGRASFASRITIYVESSGAIFVGVSSLLLCVAIGAQLPLVSKISDGRAAFTLVNFTWFAINVFALAHFVLRTIAFIHPVRRKPIIRAYVANVIWPRELTRTVTTNRWGNVVDYGHLPAGDAADPLAQGEKARTWYSAIWDGGEPRVTRHFHKRVRLFDVRLAMLAPVVRAWLAHARSEADGQTHDFVIPLEPGHDYQGDVTLTRATLPLGPIARWAVWASFRFRATSAEDGSISETAAILREMIADLIALIETRQADEFGNQLRDVIGFHAFLYRLAQTSNGNVSYAQFEDAFGRALSDDWVRAYRDMTRRAVERLPEETWFVGVIAHASATIYSRVAGEVTPEALKPMLRLNQSLAYFLVDWAVGEHRAGSETAAAGKRAFTLSHQKESYSQAWRDLVAGWERLFQAIASSPNRRKRGEMGWDDLRRVEGNIDAHLRATTQMAAYAVLHGDTLATSWTCDLILHWQIQAENAWNTSRDDWRLRSETLTLEMLESNWAEVEELPLIQGGGTLKPAVVFGAIMKNAWRDHVVVLAGLCVNWAMHANAAATTTQAARMLLQGEPHDRGDTGVRDESGINGAKLLISVLRITGSGVRFSESSYAGRIEHLLEGLGQLGEAPWVSMRVYSSSGGLSFDALQRALALSMMATSLVPQLINGELRRLLTQSDYEALRRRERYLKTLLVAFDELEAAKHGALLAELAGQGGEASFNSRRDNARQLVEQSLEILSRERDEAILSADLDSERIAAVARAASSDAFKKIKFPLNLFAQVTQTSEALCEFTFRVTGESKGAYTDPPMAEIAMNEEEWWRDATSSWIADVVWVDVIRKAAFQDVEARTPDEFWSAVRDGSARIRKAGNDPILVIGNVNDPGWLADWCWPNQQSGSPKPADLVITKDENQCESYEFTMNDTPVYRARTADGVVYLLSAQLLRALRYHVYHDGLAVTLRFEPDSDDPLSGTMLTKFERKVELGDDDAFRILWKKAPGTSEVGS